MDVMQLRKGLWRWTAPHPEWRPEKGGPGGWERDVGCVFFEPPVGEKDGAVLIDPLAPSAGTLEAARFWDALDRDLERIGRSVVVVLTGFYHQRSAGEFRERYGAAVWAPESARERLTCPLARTFREGDPLPGGLEAHEIAGPERSEFALWIPAHRALVIADALIGAGGGRVRLAPPSWAEPGPEGEAQYRGPYGETLRRLLALPLEMLLVSHGEPVLERGREALAEALASPAWGEK
jgi:glyoxylase-like metal-dependent hydrolase (beta-lactamase superfamily II)